MITPRAGDVWKCSKVTIAHPSGAYGEMFNYWFIYKLIYGLCRMTNDGAAVMLEQDIEDGKNGWELVWREGWGRGQ